MANLCDFSMLVKGKKENIEKFYSALTQKTCEAWMGRGADAEINYDDDENALISGYCKWSISSSLIDDAVSMEKQRTTGKGRWYWEDEIKNVKLFITLYEACERYNVNMEVFSEEPGCCFAEHYKYENGNIEEEIREFHEEYDEETGDYLGSNGGYERDFDLADVA